MEEADVVPPPGDLAGLHGAAEAEVSAPVAGGAGPRDHGAVDMSTATEHAALGGDPDHAVPEPSRRVPRSQGAGPAPPASPRMRARTPLLGLVVVPRTLALQGAEDALSLALLAMVVGTRPPVSPAMVRAHLEEHFGISGDRVSIHRTRCNAPDPAHGPGLLCREVGPTYVATHLRFRPHFA